VTTKSSNILGVIAILMVTTTLCAGCDSASETLVQADPEPATTEALGDTYLDGLDKDGDAQLMRLELTTSSPEPKYTGNYTWTLSVFDVEENPIAGAEVIAEPTMPAHGHGTFPKVTLGDEVEPGRYELVDMDLFMPGLWRISVEVRWGSDSVDTSHFEFDLQG
jgi:hypothetical protein